MMTKILYAGFEGVNNCSKRVLDGLGDCEKVYLENDKVKSVVQLSARLATNLYDYCIILGQKPVMRNKIAIELQAKEGNKTEKTVFDYNKIMQYFVRFGIDCYLSKNAGNSYCNNIYYQSLVLIKNNNLKTKVVFVHIPYKNNFADFDKFCDLIKNINLD